LATHHAAELNKIVLEIKNDEDLKFMDAHIYPEWERLIRNQGDPAPYMNLWLPTDPIEIRKGFYQCFISGLLLLTRKMSSSYSECRIIFVKWVWAEERLRS
jgi:hypothetical protein